MSVFVEDASELASRVTSACSARRWGREARLERVSRYRAVGSWMDRCLVEAERCSGGTAVVLAPDASLEEGSDETQQDTNTGRLLEARAGQSTLQCPRRVGEGEGTDG